MFVAVTSEFLPTGLLPDIARNLRVSEPQVGLLVSAFAATVVITSAPLTTFTRRVPRKSLVVFVLVGFALGNGLAAVAPNYDVLLVARIVSGFAHGLFGAVVGAYAGHMVPRRHLARAVAITAAGGSAAFVLGVPLGTLLGHTVGWRLAFAVIGVIVLLLTLFVIRFLPAVDHRDELSTGEIALPLRRDPTIPAVILTCVIVVVLMMGQNTFYTYIAPYIARVGGFGEDQVGVLLLLYGSAGVLGLAAAGSIGSRFPRFGVIGITAVLAVVIAVFGAAGQIQWAFIACLVLWGALMGSLPVLLQTRLLHDASSRLRDVAAAYLTTAYNVAIGGGALLGGLLSDRLGLRSLPWAYFVFLIGVLVLMAGAELLRSCRARAVPTT